MFADVKISMDITYFIIAANMYVHFAEYCDTSFLVLQYFQFHAPIHIFLFSWAFDLFILFCLHVDLYKNRNKKKTF